MSLIPGIPSPPWAVGSTDPASAVNTALERLAFLARGGVLSRTEDTEPGSPANGDAYIMTSGRTGTNWATYSENDIAVWLSGAWFVISPADVLGVPFLVNDEGSIVRWNASEYEVVIGGDSGAVVIEEVSGTTRTLTDADAGKILRFTNASAKTLTVNTGLTGSRECLIDNPGAGALTINGTMTVGTPKGGTKVLEQDDAVTLVIFTSTTAKIYGSTEPA